MNLLTLWSELTSESRDISVKLKLTMLGVMILLNYSVFSQVLFLEECFVGGVQTGGHGTIGSMEGGSFEIHWEEGYVLRKAYALSYRYGRPEPHSFFLNGSPIEWNMSSQAGPELLESNDFSNYFASHAVDITNLISIENNVVDIDLPEQTFYDFAWNWGWWGAYIVILYESPAITSEVCTRIYIADQTQDLPQDYIFETPNFVLSTPLLFAIYSHRMADFYEDASRILINGEFLGDIWSPDLVTPLPSSGVQGHFFYHNSSAEGLNGDTANNTLNKHDGIAIINDYLQSDESQHLKFYYLDNPTNPGFNPHPAFLLTYTPGCVVQGSSLQGVKTFCRGEKSELQAIPGYDYYAWTPGHQLSDSTIANPICFADSSRWYRVRMWSDDGEVCPQTIPVFVEVGQTPRPDPLQVRRSTCPSPTGTITFVNTAGKAPFTYTVGSTTQPDSTFTFLQPGAYDVSVTDALGCAWDSTVTVPLNAPVEAAFTANPTTGDTPLDVYFFNHSTPSATSFEWLLNGTPFSASENTSYTFSDSGTYVVSLVAFYQDMACSDTASFTIRVDQGIELIVPNIFTPNGDRRNDQLVAQVRGVERLSWEVYNRWGNLLHNGAASGNTENIELWNGDEVPSGVYSIILTATGINGRTKRMDVAVTVVR